MTLRFLFFITLIIISFLMGSTTQSCASSGWLIYYEGGFRGKIIDAETKAPIEGAVVVAEYRIRTCGPLFVPECGGDTVDVKEVLTNKDGEFKIYGHLFFYLWPFTLGGESTYFIIFKPGYKTIETYLPADIYAIGQSTIGYLEEHKITTAEGNQYVDYATKKFMTYSEGLIYTGEDCTERITSLEKTTPFRIFAIYLPMANAMEKIKKLEIPLDCPKDGAPVPQYAGHPYNLRNDIEEYAQKSFLITKLQKLKTWKERRDANAISPTDDEKQWPLLHEMIKKEDEWLENNKGWKR